MKGYFDDKPDITYIDQKHFDPYYYDMLYDRDNGSLCGTILSNMSCTNELWFLYNCGYEVMTGGKSPVNNDFFME